MTENTSPSGIPPLLQPPSLEQAKAACQWFLGETRFCDKIKKEVKCDGNVGKCPF